MTKGKASSRVSRAGSRKASLMRSTEATISSYSNLGVGLLGVLLSRVYGKPWEVLVAEKIIGPLGMKDTVVNLSDDHWSKRTVRGATG